MISKPMLAAKSDGENLSLLKFPVLATPKLDGIRCLIIGGKALTRAFKPIPNDYIRQTLEMTCNSMCLDGEIMIPGKNFNDLSGDVRRKDGRPTTFYYAVFDFIGATYGGKDLLVAYRHRMDRLRELILPACCKKILPVEINTIEELDAYEQKCIDDGYEGVMLRSPDGPYKCGRATWKEGYLIKIKRFADDEATVIDYEEEMHNNNPAEEDAFGRTKRSSHQENLVGKGTLGKLICISPKWPKEFGIGTGYDAKTREALWKHRDELKGKLVKFKHQPCGAKDRPRIPVFLGFRDKWDL